MTGICARCKRQLSDDTVVEDGKRWHYHCSPSAIAKGVHSDGKIRKVVDPQTRAEIASTTAAILNRAVFDHKHEQLMKGSKANWSQERNNDCMAVAINENNRMIVAGNVKTREEVTFQNVRVKAEKFSEFGIQNSVKVITETLKGTKVAENGVTILGGTDKLDIPNSATRQDHQELAKRNAAAHAEMQILNHLLKSKDSSGAALGVSKPPCNNCKDQLVTNGVVHQSEEGLGAKKVTNWEPPESVKVAVVGTIKPKAVRIEQNFTKDPYALPLKRDLVHTVERMAKPENYVANLKASVKPGVGGSAMGVVESLANDLDRKGGASAKKCFAQAGEYTTNTSTGVFAKASLYEAEAHFSVFDAVARGPTAMAGVHITPLSAEVMATAQLVRAEARAVGVCVGVGLSLDTGASVGAGGAQVNLLGFGFAVGPKFAIKTPFFDFSFGL